MVNDVRKLLLLVLLFIPINVSAFESSAKSAILMDMDSGRVLYEKNSDYVQSVASISKIMTAIIAIENNDIEREVIIGDEVLKAYGSGIYVQVGEKLKIKDLLYGLLMRSGNDAALALAFHTSGDISKFVELMNLKGQKLGMKNTIFHNPCGLDEEDEGNLSSSFDMALLMKYAMKNKIFREIVKTKSYSLKTNKNVYKWKNKHKLLYSYKYMTGGKTGYTKKAKRTLVSTASKNNLNLTIVTINDANDFKDHVSLFEEAFEKYTNYIFLKKGVIKIPLDYYYRGDSFYIKKNVSYPLSVNEEKLVKIKYELFKVRNYKNNDMVGYVKVYLGNLLVRKEKIYIRVKK